MLLKNVRGKKEERLDVIQKNNCKWSEYKKSPKSQVAVQTYIIINQNHKKLSLINKILEKAREIALQRTTYGTRRMAAMLTRTLKIAVNRKRVQKIFRKLGYTIPSKTKREIIRSKDKNVNTSRSNEI